MKVCVIYGSESGTAELVASKDAIGAGRCWDHEARQPAKRVAGFATGIECGADRGLRQRPPVLDLSPWIDPRSFDGWLLAAGFTDSVGHSGNGQPV